MSTLAQLDTLRKRPADVTHRPHKIRVKGIHMVANTGTDAHATDENGTPRYIAVITAPDFYAAIKAEADKENIAPSAWVKRLVADKLGFTLIDTPRSKYTNEAEKKAAQVKARVDKVERTHLLFIEHYEKLAAAGDSDAAAKAARERKLLDKMREKLAKEATAE